MNELTLIVSRPSPALRSNGGHGNRYETARARKIAKAEAWALTLQSPGLAVADGDIFVGNFASGAYLLDRKQSTIKYFDQDRDNAIKNLITIVIEERVALPVVQPDSFVYTTVTAAKAALIAA